MKSTVPFFYFIFILYYLSLPSPLFGQPFDWDDAHLHGRVLTPEMEAAVKRPFARLTERMNANPRDYANDILFPNFYPQLAECTRPTGRNGALQFTAACEELLIFLMDLDLLPRWYRRNPRAVLPDRPWFDLEKDWLAFYRSLPPPPAGQQQIASLVADHPVEVPPALVPLIHHPPYLSLDFLTDGRGGATISYHHLIAEFMRNQAVYATKNARGRKGNSFNKSDVSRNRLLKLRAIYMLMVGENLEGAGENEGESDEQEPSLPPPPPPIVEDAVVEEEQQQQQQHPHQDQDQADSLSPAPSSPPPPLPDDHSEDNLLGLNLDDFSDWLDEQLDQNTEDDPDFFLNWDPLQPAPAASPVPEMVGLYATTPFVSDINGGDDDDNKDVPIKQKRPLEDDEDEDDDIVNFDRWYAKYFPSDGEPQLRSMNKESGKRLKKASALGLVTLITFAFIAAIIFIIWALYSVFRKSHLYKQQQQLDEESTSATTAITATDNI